MPRSSSTRTQTSDRNTASTRTTARGLYQNLFINSGSDYDSAGTGFDNASWTKSNCTITYHPELTIGTTRYVVTDNAVNNAHFFTQTPSGISLSKGDIVSVGCMTKKGSLNFLLMAGNNGATYSFFNLNTGATGTKSSDVLRASITPMEEIIPAYEGYGLYWAMMTFPVKTLNAIAGFGVSNADGALSYIGDGTGTIWVDFGHFVKANYSSPLNYSSTLNSPNTSAVRSLAIYS